MNGEIVEVFKIPDDWPHLVDAREVVKHVLPGFRSFTFAPIHYTTLAYAMNADPGEVDNTRVTLYAEHVKHDCGARWREWRLAADHRQHVVGPCPHCGPAITT
jgi:hypothetical protein